MLCGRRTNTYFSYTKYIVRFTNMAASKLEINFRRLLERCEAMASEIQENKENVSWRLEKVSCSIHQKIVFYCFLSRI